MENEFTEFTLKWHQYAMYISYALAGLAVLMVLFYNVRLLATSGSAKKYDFVTKSEASSYWNAFLSFVIGLIVFMNGTIEKMLNPSNAFEFFFGIFIAFIIGFAVGYAGYAYFKFYYPSVIEGKLTKIRFKPRISPKTGKALKLLTEDEEDIHLTEEMIKHEDELIYEYDVWLDEETGDKFIERYDGHKHNHLCGNCNFRTLRDYREEVMKSPTDTESGVLSRYFKCSYCGHHEVRESKISPLEKEVELLS